MNEKKVGEPLNHEKEAVLLARLMLAWDGQWFLKTAQSCGLEKAVVLNARVRTSFGRIEIREFLREKGIAGAADVAEACALLAEYQRIFLREGMAAEWAVEGDSVTVAVTRCRPQEGAGKAGLRPDTPCVACESVWGAWLETALPGSTWRTEVRHSMGRGAGQCKIVVRKVNGE